MRVCSSRFRGRVVACAVLLATTTGALAQAGTAGLGGTPPMVLNPPPQNVMTLSAQASREVPQDWLTMVLSTTREASDAAVVQQQLRAALDAALTEARRQARPGQLEVRTGTFAVSPRYAPRGGLSGWQGTAELVLEGRDTAAIAQLAGRLQTLTVGRVSFSLSREAREQVETEVASMAIDRFRASAEAYAKRFGFGGYALREVQVMHGHDGGMPVPLMRVQAMAASAEAAPVPVEAGRATVTATVSGSVQMTIR